MDKFDNSEKPVPGGAACAAGRPTASVAAGEWKSAMLKLSCRSTRGHCL